MRERTVESAIGTRAKALKHSVIESARTTRSLHSMRFRTRIAPKFFSTYRLFGQVAGSISVGCTQNKGFVSDRQAFPASGVLSDIAAQGMEKSDGGTR
jgi:hypothetical protein